MTSAMTTDILGVRIDNMPKEEIHKRLRSFLDEDRFHWLVTLNPEIVLHAHTHPAYAKKINSANLGIVDGFGISLVKRLQGKHIKSRYTGVDICWDVARMAAGKNKKIFLLGGKENSATRAADILRRKYSAEIRADSGGKIKKLGNAWRMDQGLIEKINNSKADILLVALGHPKQEEFIHDFREQLPHVRLAIGVGGAFDFISGNIARAPKLLRALGLEWLFRLIKQPWRMKRIARAVIVFPAVALWHAAGPCRNKG